jgi:excisionase family DNA binding protein
LTSKVAEDHRVTCQPVGAIANTADEQLLTVKQLAAESGISDQQIYRLVKAGQIAHVRFSARGSIRIRRADWARCLERHTKAAEPPRRWPADLSDLPGHDRYSR